MGKKLIQWVEINSSALIHNLQQFRNLVGDNVQLLVVVKANAYGHGILEISRMVLKEKVDWLGVNSVEEGLLLRQEGIDCPLIALGYVPSDELEKAVANNLRLTVYNFNAIPLLAEIAHRLKKKVFLHLKVETGTYRQGIEEKEILPFIKETQKFPGLVIEGLTSHFANIEDTTDHSYPRSQLRNFQSIIKKLRKNKVEIPIKHMSCSASTILFPETYFNMVRVGIGAYGLWPSKETYLSCLLKKRRPLFLKPVLSWKTRIAQIKKVPKGAFIGYGCTYRTTRETTLAVLPVGYYDGYDRSLSNSSYVLINASRAPLRGRVCMNFIMVDITDIPGVSIEDEVVLLGRDGEEVLSADYLANLAGSINYEIVSRINPLIPRLIV
jgi:alanine racemase